VSHDGAVTNGRNGVGHDVLWRIGTWFTRSGAIDYDEVVTDALAAFALKLGAHSANIWSVSLADLDAEVRHRWASGPGSDLGPGAEMLVDQKVVDLMAANHGAMVMSDRLLVGSERAEELGWSNGQSGVAIISQTDTTATAVVVGASSGNWGEVEVDMLRGFATLLRQFDRRVDDERHLQLRLQLDQLVVAGSGKLLAAKHGECEEVVHELLHELREIIAARVMALIYMAPDQDEAEVVIVDSINPVPESLLRFSESDYSPLAGIAGDTLRQAIETEQEFLLEPALVDLIGPELLKDAGLSKESRSAVVMPASAKGTYTTSILVVRDTDSAWFPEELDATKTIASLIAQARVRADAEEQSRFRLGALEVLGQASAAFIDVEPASFGDGISSALETVGSFLGLDALSTWQVHHANQTYMIDSRWSADPARLPDPSSPVAWGESTAFDSARLGSGSVSQNTSPESGGWSSVVVPSGDGDIDRLLVASRLSDKDWPDDIVAALETLGRTIDQAAASVASQAYAAAAFGSAPVGVLIADQDQRIVSCNRALADFLGVDSPEDLIGAMPADYMPDPLDDSKWATVGDYFEQEIAFRQSNGARVWAQVRFTRMEGAAEGAWRWLGHVEDITQRRRAIVLLRWQATHDELTGLSNRRDVLLQIKNRLTTSADMPLAVLLLDLDRFKVINDSLGHDRGDELLVVISDRLRLAVRPGDLVARLGGDEFAVLLMGPTDLDAAQRMSQRLLDLIGEPITLGSQVVYPSSSVGIAVSDGQADAAELLRRADIAMYRAKAEGRGRFEAFDEELRYRVVERMDTEAGLRGALRNDELVVHYQPEFSLSTGDVVGAEALIRWQHPTRGILAAGAFIEVAEEAGLLLEIGEIVLRQACLEATEWHHGPTRPTVAVNLSASQMQREETVDLVRSILLEVGLAASQLCLEITESSMMRDPVRAEKILGMLKDLGVKLAVDDFGTGFSSLSYLKRFPVDILKIDQSFVSDLGIDRDNEKFVNSILRLADTLGLEVIAEGVETEQQADILRALGCQTVQGYFFAKPGPAEAMRARLAR